MRPVILSSVVDHDLCIGCGLCSAMCPDNTLEMQFNKFGEYNPVSINECTTECGLCLKVCPFGDSGENEDTIGKRLYGEIPGIQYRAETGYYLDTYVGFSERHRPISASGGIATWTLEALFTEGIVDHVICVGPTGNPEKLFAFHVFDTPEDVRTGAGSAYYPVEMSGVIRHVIDHPGRYAITGLPCFIKAVRLAQQRNKKLDERIVVTVGLVCGQLKSSHFTDYIATLAGVQGEVTAVRYRGKSPDQPASNYHYTFKTADGNERKISWNEGISGAWTNRWFTPNACNYCDDVFAECADVVCMDAWLPEHSRESRGTSLVLVRLPVVQKIIEGGAGIILNSIPVEKIIQSQAGVLVVKRPQLMYRLYIAHQKGLKVPGKRVRPTQKMNFFLRQEVLLKERMRLFSREKWIDHDSERESFREMVQPDLRRLQRRNRVSRVITLPLRFISRAMRGYRHE